MNLEVVEFYPSEVNGKSQTYRGTMHVYLIDLGIDIRGINVKGNKNRVYINLPWKNARDKDTNELVRFPVFDYTDKEKSKLFKKSLFEACQKYVKEEFVAKGLAKIDLKLLVKPPKPPKKAFHKKGKKPFTKKPMNKKPGTFNKFTNFVTPKKIEKKPYNFVG